MHRSDLSGASAHAGAEPATLTVRRQLALSVLWLGVNAQSAALMPIIIPLQILLFVAPGTVGGAQQATFLGWLSAGGAVIALFTPPLVGALSDRTTLSLGRRRPYILTGAVLAVIGAWTLAQAADLTTLVIGFLLLQFGFNVLVGGYQGLLPDLVPEEQRGAASGYLGLMTILGNVGSLALAGFLLSGVTAESPSHSVITSGAGAFYLISGAMLIVTTLITVIWVSESPLRAALHPNGATTSGAGWAERRLNRLREMWLEPWTYSNFTWVFLTRGFVMLGLTLFLTFIEYFFVAVAHVSNFVTATAVVAALALLGAAISALALGILSDYFSRTLIVGVSSGLMALAAITFVVAPQRIPLWPLGIVFGLGYGAYTSVDWALAVDTLPRRENAGKDLGIWSAASTLPAVVAPVVGSAVIQFTILSGGPEALGYQLIFVLAAVCLSLGAIFVSFITEERARAQRIIHRARRPGAGWRLAGGSGGGQARGWLRFWPFWERVTHFFAPTTPIPAAPHGLLEVHFTRWRGQPITLPDGQRIERDNPIGMLHFNNHRVAEVAETARAWDVLRMLAEDLRALAAWASAETGPQMEARAFMGATLLARPGKRLGFTLRERPVTIHARLDRFFMEGLLAIYNPRGVQRLREGGAFSTYPVEAWMSRATLLSRYAPSSAGWRAAPTQSPSPNQT